MPAPSRIAAVVTAAGVLLLAGCTGGSDGPDPTPSASPTASAAAPEPTAAPTTPAPDATEPAPDPSSPPADPPTAPAGLTTVTPFVSYAGPGAAAGTIEVAAFVPDLVENGGTCTATIPGTATTVSGAAFADATSTSCGVLVLPVAPAGQTVVVTYTSPTSAGTSEPTAVQ